MTSKFHCLKFILLGALAYLAPPSLAAASCDAIRNLAIDDVTIHEAVSVAAGASFKTAAAQRESRHSFCRVTGVIETEIGFELWLPEPSVWNQRFLAGGVGGQAGQLNYVEMFRGLQRGYATASTDTGHKADDEHWLLGPAIRADNYAWRANHLLAQKAKLLIQKFYAGNIKHAFFVGCSGGGRQALTEAQRFPEDFDGVIAGAPGPNTPEMSARRLWEMIQHRRNADLMSARDWQLIADSAVNSCDLKDGVRDGVMEDPRSCDFEIRSLQCTAGSRACLSKQQIDIAQRIYAPLHDESGKKIDSGLLPGVPISPVPLPEPYTPGPKYLAAVLFGDGVHRDPDWDAMQFRIDRDLPAVDKVMNLHADNPDLRRFQQRGGKLILFQGWADSLVAAQPTIDYYQSIGQFMSKVMDKQAPQPEFVKLFMVPGMGHCTGGNATDHFGGTGNDGIAQDPQHDLLSALERWVENGDVPEQVIGAKLENGKVVRTRPLCAFPKTARYRGGDSNQAQSFICQ